MKLTREKLRRMFDQNTGQVILGGGGGGDVDLTGVATEAWVEENYISKQFFGRLFTIHSATGIIDPNDPDEEQTIDSIEALVGLWTEQYLSALGQGSGGGGGGGITLNEPLASINNLGAPTGINKVLLWNGSSWGYSSITAGSVTSVALAMPTGFTVTNTPITSTGTLTVNFGGTVTKNYVLASPASADGAPSWRALVSADIPDLGSIYAKVETVYTKTEADAKFMTIAAFENLFNALNSSNQKVSHPYSSSVASIKALFGLWTEQYISALGQSSGGGGGITLNEPLASINSLGAPTGSNKILLWNGSSWTYSPASSGSVTGIVLGSGNPYTPVNGIVTLPAYPDVSGYLPLTGGTLTGMLQINPSSASECALATTSTDGTNVSYTRLSYADGTGFYLGSTLSTNVRGKYLFTIRNGVSASSPSGGNVVMHIDGSGKIGIGTGTPSYALDVVGAVRSSSGFIGNLTGNADTATSATSATSATKLTTARTLWGQSFDGSANVNGDMTDVGFIYMNNNSWIGIKDSNATNRTVLGLTNNNEFFVGYGAASAGYNTFLDGNAVNIRYGTSRTNGIVLSSTGATSLTGTLSVVGATSITSTLSVTGLITASGGVTIPSGKTLTIGDAVLSWDSNQQAIKITKGFYSDTFISALGNSSGGGGSVTLNQPLSAINSAGLSAAGTSGQTLVYSNGAWKYSTSAGITAAGLTILGNATASGYVQANQFKKVGGTGTNVLLDDGSVIALSSIGGGSYLPLTGGTLTGDLNITPSGTNIWALATTSTDGTNVSYARLSSSNGTGFYLGTTLTADDSSKYILAILNGVSASSPSGGNYIMYIKTGGNIGIRTASPSYALDVVGAVRASSGFIGNLTGNADTATSATSATSATKLATARTLWGQSFDGSANITGDMTDVGSIHMTNNSWIWIKDANGTDRTVLGLTVNNQFFVGYSAAAAGCDMYLDANNLYIRYSTSRTTGITLSSSGAVTIAKTLTVTGLLTANGNIATSSSNGSYVQIGAVRLVYDSTNNALKVVGSDGSTAANLYTTGGLSALGQSSTSSSYLDQATADARYLKLSGGTLTSALTVNGNFTSSSTVKGTSGLMTAYMTVGTSSVNSSYTLYVNGNAAINNIVIGNEQQVNSVDCAVIQTRSNKGIYIKSGSAPNYVDGTWQNASDIRLKDIVSNAGASVEQVANAPVFNYKWKAGGTQVMLGTSAQYWRNVFNFGVNEGPDSYLYMDYASIALASAVMVARKVQSHEERIAALEAENARLQKELNDIKAA